MGSVRLAVSILLAGALAGCGGRDHGCGSARGTLPDGLTVLTWDHDTPSFSVRDKSFSITPISGGKTFHLATDPLWEAVRFDLTRPAKIYGFSILWNHLDAVAGKGRTPLEAGLYPDFGGNGFDFWSKAPQWTGTRCVSDAQQGEVQYVLAQPLEITQPGLVYVAHFAAKPEDPTFTADSHGHDCTTFAICHSAFDLPEAYPDIFFNGTSGAFPYDYIVRLYVEYAPDPATTVFQKVAGPVMGLRMAWGDYDNDGFDDILTQDQNDLFSSHPVLWHNEGDGTFTDATASSGLSNPAFWGSGAWGDYDNDGCLDAFLTSEDAYVGDSLVHGDCAGHFTDVTAQAGIAGAITPETNPCPTLYGYEQTEAATWVDLDGDGLLDVYKSTYNCGGPTSADFVDDVYRNRGDGTFEVWTGTHGFAPYGTASRGAVAVDLDQDGDMDVLVQDYVLERNLYFRNAGNGSVQEIAKGNGLAGDRDYFQGDPYYGHTLGAAVGDLDGDGDWDVIETNLAHPRFFEFSDKTRVLLNDGGNFRDLSGDWSKPRSDAGLRYQETHTVPLLADFDEDGRLDLAISARSDRATGDERPMEFYWGNGDGTFRDAMFGSGLDAKNGWGLAGADYDHDGDVDIATYGSLFRNTMRVGTNHWLQVHCVGNVTSNRPAFGATLKVHAGGKTFLRYVAGSTGQGDQDSMNLHFGLGNVTTIDSIEVSFPGGATKTWAGPIAADQRVWVYEDGTLLPGWSNPP